jgi:outer membrane protein TolC
MERLSMRYPMLRASMFVCAALAISSSAHAQDTVRLSVDDAVKLALEQNLGIRIERLNPQIQDVTVAQSLAAWNPSVNAGLSRNSQTIPAASALAGAAAVTDRRFSSQFGVTQTLKTGTNYSFDWTSARLTSNNIFTNYVPQLNAGVSFQITQPLLRNRTIDASRQSLDVARLNRDASDVQLQSTIVTTTRNVKSAYWDLAFQRDNLKAQQQSLDLAKRLLSDNERRVQIGTMAPIDIVEAQSEVARNEEAVIVAEAGIRQAEDRLRALIYDPARPDFWSVVIEPTESMSFTPQPIDTDAAIRRALSNRTDVALAKNSLAQSEVNMRFHTNQSLPQIDAQANYSSNGLGGVRYSSAFSLGDEPPPPRTVEFERSYGRVLGDVLVSEFPTWSVGVNVTYAIGDSASETGLARARLQYSQAQQQLRNMELQITTQVRDAARTVQTNQKRVDSARAARELAERRLDAEERKFTAGIQTSFFVFQAQRDLAQSRTNEVRALSDYNKSLVDFEAVQETALTGTTPITTAR